MFRTNVLTVNANQSSFALDHLEFCSETPSSSSTCVNDLSKVENEKIYVTAMSLPQSLNEDRRINNETFNFIEKKVKKRSLESSSSSSSSTSSSTSLSGNNSVTENVLDNNEKENENKKNIIIQPIDKDEMPAALFNITFKFLNTETKLLRKVLIAHGLTEVTHDVTDFNLLWTGNQLKPDILRSLSSYQRINHFPR